MEEVAVGEVKDAAVALINDDSTEVGRVHFGVVHVVQVADETVASGRNGIFLRSALGAGPQCSRAERLYRP